MCWRALVNKVVLHAAKKIGRVAESWLNIRALVAFGARGHAFVAFGARGRSMASTSYISSKSCTTSTTVLKVLQVLKVLTVLKVAKVLKVPKNLAPILRIVK